MAKLDGSKLFGPLIVNGDTELRRALMVAGIISGIGSGITALNASNISTGEVPAPRLPYATSTTRGTIRVDENSGTLYIWTQD